MHVISTIARERGTCQVVLLHIWPHAKAVDDQCRQGWIRVEEGGVDDDNVDVLATQSCNPLPPLRLLVMHSWVMEVAAGNMV